uniref:YqaJ-like recombinase n=1 Tax=Pithovirus LCPAC302 TaxID=2506593 RepID=A0A481Z7D0_9VIRU|nr:MAG: YqaJ-like recombinase [Pithovirus LCPAC302]
MTDYQWVNRGTYWELLAPQGGDIWKDGRKGRTNTTASCGMAGESRFKTVEEEGKFIAGVEEEHFTEDALERMAHGTNTEPIAREWYSKYTNQLIEERGLIVPTWDLEIGASVDGDIIGTDGIIEIKCPSKMYYPLQQYMDLINNGWEPPDNFYNHIYLNHRHQMQQAMAIMGKKYCIYIVYVTTDSSAFTQRINFDQDHWNHYYPIIKNNYDKYVRPYLKDKYPILPRSH